MNAEMRFHDTTFHGLVIPEVPAASASCLFVTLGLLMIAFGRTSKTEGAGFDLSLGQLFCGCVLWGVLTFKMFHPCFTLYAPVYTKLFSFFNTLAPNLADGPVGVCESAPKNIGPSWKPFDNCVTERSCQVQSLKWRFVGRVVQVPMATGVSAGGPTLEIADFGFSNSLQARGNSRRWKFEWWTEKSNPSVFLLEMG